MTEQAAEQLEIQLVAVRHWRLGRMLALIQLALPLKLAKLRVVSNWAKVEWLRLRRLRLQCQVPKVS